MNKVQCPRCWGRGYKPEIRRSGKGMYLRTCPRCGGYGQVEKTTAMRKKAEREVDQKHAEQTKDLVRVHADERAGMPTKEIMDRTLDTNNPPPPPMEFLPFSTARHIKITSDTIVHFPGGYAEYRKCTDGTWWAHISPCLLEGGELDDKQGEIIGSRIDYVYGAYEYPERCVQPMPKETQIQHLAIQIKVKP